MPDVSKSDRYSTCPHGYVAGRGCVPCLTADVDYLRAELVKVTEERDERDEWFRSQITEHEAELADVRQAWDAEVAAHAVTRRDRDRWKQRSEQADRVAIRVAAERDVMRPVAEAARQFVSNRPLSNRKQAGHVIGLYRAVAKWNAFPAAQQDAEVDHG